MANIASGFLSIGPIEKDAADELVTALEKSGLFSYGGNVDINSGTDEINIGFSCAWNGDDCWDWIDTQLSEVSQLNPLCQMALAKSEINGYTYEYGCQHRDRVAKLPGEKKLRRQQASIPDDIFSALKICKAFDLSPGETRIVSGGSVTLVSVTATEDDPEDLTYSFTIKCGYNMDIVLCVWGDISGEEYGSSIADIRLDDYDPDDTDEEPEETAMFKEIIDDMVANIEEIYT